jgi:hypothetical protein
VNKLIIFLSISLITFSVNQAFAQTTHTINIPTGAGDINAPYFWQVETTGNTDGEITIQVMDIVQWENADQALHTVTSGTPEAGPDGVFDSEVFAPGDGFTFQFTKVGTYEYYCILHAWMVGTIKVQEAMASEVQVIHNVGQEVDENGEGVDVEYQVARKLVDASVDTSKKTVTFTLVGIISNDQLVVHLPDVLIKNPNAVWLDGVQTTDFKSEKNRGIITLTIPLEDNTNEVEILGSAVIPEFDSLLSIVMVLGIIPAIILSKRLEAKT